MEWHIKRFDELTVKELYEILKVRSEVFIVEQDCVYQDVDGKDEVSLQLFLMDGDEIAACMRILPRGISYPEASFGRILTKASYRGRGLSKEMMQMAMDYTVEVLGETLIRISAQAYLLDFYKRFGFEPTSEIYLEDGIEHCEMLYNNSSHCKKTADP